jgi:hypothetical protein
MAGRDGSKKHRAVATAGEDEKALRAGKIVGKQAATTSA